MTMTHWIVIAALAWLGLAILLALFLGQGLRTADRLDRRRVDFELWHDELDLPDDLELPD